MTLRYLLVSLMLMLILSAYVYAQTDEMHRRGERNLYGFVAAEGFYTNIDGEASGVIGGAANVYVNPNIYLGLAGWALVNQPDAHPLMRSGEAYPTHWTMLWGGLNAGYVINPDKPLNFGGELSLGIGSLQRALNDDAPGVEFDPKPDTFFYVQPMLRSETTLTNWLRVSAGVGYRIVGSLNVHNTDAGDIGGPMIGLSLRFGRY